MKGAVLGLMAAIMAATPVIAADRNDRRDDRREWRQDRRDFRENRRDFRDERRDYYRDSRYWRPVARNDWRWAGPRHNGPAFAWPRGYAYQPWGVGYRLPRAFGGRPYWVQNPGFYRLPPAYRGARWVRYGPDALLIQIGNGVVLQAVRGIW